jgi:adenosylmethionine-8-amino-7-oxononanoate aminotransferase
VGVPSNSGGPIPDEYWPKIRSICDRYGILLVIDDVLEGLFRIGSAVGLKRWGVVPDAIATGKVLGSGFVPIFAMLVSAEVRDALAEDGRFWGGHTYSGHILSCEVGSAVLDEIESRKLSTTGVEFVGGQLRAVLNRICERREGARMASLGALGRLRVPTKVPGDPRAFYVEVQALMRKAGLIVWIDDVQPGHIEFSFGPPFIADGEYFHELESRLDAFVKTLPPPSRAVHPKGNP